MKTLLTYVLFVFPLAVAIAVALVVSNKNKSVQPETSVSSNTSVYKQLTVTPYTALNAPAPNIANYHHYDMSEPFAANVPFAMTPAVWMQMMSNMMNAMQMTQMMHQMAAMPEKMMNPGMWTNPHAMLPNSATIPTQQPMDPKEYKKWYEEQQKALKQ